MAVGAGTGASVGWCVGSEDASVGWCVGAGVAVGECVAVGAAVAVGANVAVGAGEVVGVAVGTGVVKSQLVLKMYVLFGARIGFNESGGGTMVTLSNPATLNASAQKSNCLTNFPFSIAFSIDWTKDGGAS